MAIARNRDAVSAAPETTGAGAGFDDQNQSDVVAHQFVIFHVEREMFAVRLSEVQEIIRMPDVVKLPMSPPALEGLANLRGTVLPILNLRDIFHFPVALHDDSTRVVVLDQGRPVGLIVDRMANVVTVDPDRIEAVTTMGSTVDTDLLSGVIKGENGTPMVMILDATAAVQREFRSMLHDTARLMAKSEAKTSGVSDAQSEKKLEQDTIADEDQLVSFEVAGQEYAFPIERVEEIIQLPENITHLPNCRGHVLGVITLRNRLLPLVSLREMFGLPVVQLLETNKVVVISLGQGVSVGVVMDGVKEVLRVARNVVDPMPALLTEGQNMKDIQSICRLKEGKRLVSVLSAERMFNAAELRQAANEIIEESDMASSEALRSSIDNDHDEQFVVFRLLNEEYGVPIDAVQEIVRVPEELTRVPKTPGFVEGVINLRGVVLPVLDQRRRFGLAGLERNDRQRIMVFMINEVRTGFIVDSVSEVMRINKQCIGPAPSLSEEQSRLIHRVANLEDQKRLILLLEVTQLLNFTEMEDLKSAA